MQTEQIFSCTYKTLCTSSTQHSIFNKLVQRLHNNIIIYLINCINKSYWYLTYLKNIVIVKIQNKAENPDYNNLSITFYH